MLNLTSTLALLAAEGVTGSAPAAPAAPKAPAKKAKTKKASAKSTKGKKAKKQANSLVPARYKEKYAAHDQSNGDTIAKRLKEATETTNADGRPCLDEPKLKAIAKANGIDYTPYAHLNNGQKRMNVGNKLRGLVKSGTPVKIGSTVVSHIRQAA